MESWVWSHLRKWGLILSKNLEGPKIKGKFFSCLFGKGAKIASLLNLTVWKIKTPLYKCIWSKRIAGEGVHLSKLRTWTYNDLCFTQDSLIVGKARGCGPEILRWYYQVMCMQASHSFNLLMLNQMQGPKLTFFDRCQLATESFLQSPNEKCGHQKVSVKLFLCRKIQAKIGCHRLVGKIFAIDVIENQTSAKIIFRPLWQIYIASFWCPENIYMYIFN